MEKELNITIVGEPKSGASTLAAYVARVLRDQGLENVMLSDPDYDPPMSNVNALGLLQKVGNKTRVTIHVHQTPRKGSSDGN